MRRLARAPCTDRDFELHYQPVVDLVSGRAIGAEALLRWRRDGALVTAADFVPFAESSGQIRAIGQVVLHLVVADLERLGPGLPHGFRVSVNLSAPEVADPDVIDFCCTGPLSPMLEHLAVEVTEGIAVAEYPRVEEHVARLREAGAVIAIDDFGAGFANIDALQSLQPQVIKVDRVFARRAAQGDPAVYTLPAGRPHHRRCLRGPGGGRGHRDRAPPPRGDGDRHPLRAGLPSGRPGGRVAPPAGAHPDRARLSPAEERP